MATRLTLNRSLQLGRGLIADRLHVLLELIAQIHKGVQLVDHRAGVGLEEGQLSLLLTLHLPPQVRAPCLEIVKGRPMVVLQEEPSSGEVLLR